MANIVIKKRVNLDFLGKDYADSYLEFKAMTISEYETLVGDMQDMDNAKSVRKTVEILKSHFLDGKFLDEKVDVKDLEQFDVQTLLTCLEYFTGQKTDPKV